MRQFKNVLKFEYLSYVKNKTYIISTAIIFLVIVIACNIPNIFSVLNSLSPSSEYETGVVSDSAATEGDKSLKAAIYDPNGDYSDDILNKYFGQYEWTRLTNNDQATIQNDVISEKYDLCLEINGLDYTITRMGSGLMSFNTANFDGMIKTVYQTKVLENKGISQADIDDILSVSPRANFVSVGKDITQTFWVGYVLLLVLYMAVLLYGKYVMTSVIVEKSSKTMELLITSVKPVHLIFGKVIGVGLAGLTQFVILTGTALITLNITKVSWLAFSPEIAGILNLSTATGTLIYAVIFFLLGFFIYAFLFAGFASTVSRQEEANSVVTIPMLLFIGAFMVSIMSMTDAGASYVTTLSYVPFFSPLVMFMRICITDVTFAEILIAIIINFVSVIIVGILSAKIYKTGVMMYGKPPKILDVLKYIVKS